MDNEKIREIASIAWRGAANAHRMYPDNKHTFTEYWYAAKSQFESFSDKEVLLAFKQWYDKLSPANKCTVCPPPGSGSGTGLYNMSDEDLIEKFIKKISEPTKQREG